MSAGPVGARVGLRSGGYGRRRGVPSGGRAGPVEVSGVVGDLASWLQEVEPFRGFEGEAAVSLARRAVVRRLAAGVRVFGEEDPGSHVYWVRRGAVHILKHGLDGSERLLRICGPREFFGAVVVFSPGGYPATAVAATEVELVALHRDDLLAPPAAARVLAGLGREMGRQLRRAQRRLAMLGARGAEARLADLLLQLALSPSPPVRALVLPETLTHAQLASYLGCARETVSRIVGRWRALGWLGSQDGRFVILRPDALRRRARWDEDLRAYAGRAAGDP